MRVSVVSVDESRYPIVRVTLTAERDGRPLGEPAAGDVTVTVAGRPVPVRSVSAQTDTSVPVSVVLAIDVSGSMAGDTMTRAREAASSLVAALGPSDRAAVVAFGSTVRVVQPLTQSKPALQAAISGLQAGGDTALYDAIVRAAGLALESGTARRTVIVLSDGEDFGGRSTATRATAAAAAGQSGAVFYAAGVGESFDRSFLVELASATGGRFFEAGGAADIPPLYVLMSSLLRGQYTVEFEAPAATGPDASAAIVGVRFGSDTGSANFSLAPRAAPPTATVPLSPTQTTAAASPTVGTGPDEESGGGSGNAGLIVAGLVGVLALAGAGGYLGMRRRRTTAQGMAGGPGRGAPQEPQPPPLPFEADAGWRATFRVSRAGESLAVHHLGPEPVTFGSDATCQVVLPADPGVAPFHARVWHRDGRTMLHHVGPGIPTTVNGQPADWTTLADGDRIAIGPFEVTYTGATEPGN